MKTLFILTLLFILPCYGQTTNEPTVGYIPLSGYMQSHISGPTWGKTISTYTQNKPSPGKYYFQTTGKSGAWQDVPEDDYKSRIMVANIEASVDLLFKRENCMIDLIGALSSIFFISLWRIESRIKKLKK